MRAHFELLGSPSQKIRLEFLKDWHIFWKWNQIKQKFLYVDEFKNHFKELQSP